MTRHKTSPNRESWSDDTNTNILTEMLQSLLLPDLTIESSTSYKKLIELLRGADYVIEENGWVAAWGAASFELNCKSMEFSNYPYDKHKCEFFIRSDFYTDVTIRRNVMLSYTL